MFICNVIIASDSLKGARVNKGQYVCIYDPKNKNKAIKPCAWTRREMLLK